MRPAALYTERYIGPGRAALNRLLVSPDTLGGGAAALRALMTFSLSEGDK